MLRALVVPSLALALSTIPMALTQNKPEPADSFEKVVKPVLARTCIPCHVAGGQMYERLPFDKPDVVRANKDGILRRLKGEDKDVVEKWLKAPRDEKSSTGQARP